MIRRTYTGVIALSVALVGCAGDDERVTTGLSGGYNPTQTGTATQTTSAGTTDESSTSGVAGTQGESDSNEVTSSSSDTNPTTSTTDPTTSTTTSSSTTDPTTSTSTTTTTTTTTSTSTSTSTSTTGNNTTMGGNDPQPASGLYSDCMTNTDCNTAGCFVLQDDQMQYLDGYCTNLCTGPADCNPKPNSNTTTVCLMLDAMTSVCALSCNADADCPVGMTCEGVAIDNKTYCW